MIEENEPESEWFKGFQWDNEIDIANREIFGNQFFRPRQREIINATKSNKDVIGIIPTGGGKSLTFQLAAMTEDGVSIVVMPLISLIQDQMMQMEDLDIDTLFLRDRKDINDILRQISSGNIKAKLWFITPEKLNQSANAKGVWRNLYDSGMLKRFVIDEVHCVSHWGQDFRKDYLELKSLRIEYPGVPILGLTATATAQVITDIANILGLKNMIKFQCSFNRPNLFYEVREKVKNIEDQIFSFVTTKYKFASGIIYCLTIKETESLTKILSKRGVKCKWFHSKLKDDERAETQRLWMINEIRIIIATVAFGMGINKKDVRFVIHTKFPKSIESYSQECGRAGRDSKPAHWLLFYDYKDRKMLDFFIIWGEKTQASSARKEENMHNLYKMIDYLEEDLVWRRKIQLQLLGENFNSK